jgi:hypothetical protein
MDETLSDEDGLEVAIKIPVRGCFEPEQRQLKTVNESPLNKA